jgi:hypothetical protein
MSPVGEPSRSRWGLNLAMVASRACSSSGEGRKRAQARGVRFCRPPKLTPHQRREALARLEAGETTTDIARTYGVDATTIGRLRPPFAAAVTAEGRQASPA